MISVEHWLIIAGDKLLVPVIKLTIAKPHDLSWLQGDEQQISHRSELALDMRLSLLWFVGAVGTYGAPVSFQIGQDGFPVVVCCIWKSTSSWWHCFASINLLLSPPTKLIKIHYPCWKEHICHRQGTKCMLPIDIKWQWVNTCTLGANEQ